MINLSATGRDQVSVFFVSSLHPLPSCLSALEQEDFRCNGLFVCFGFFLVFFFRRLTDVRRGAHTSLSVSQVHRPDAQQRGGGGEPVQDLHPRPGQAQPAGRRRRLRQQCPEANEPPPSALSFSNRYCSLLLFWALGFGVARGIFLGKLLSAQECVFVGKVCCPSLRCLCVVSLQFRPSSPKVRH